jgi:hypothetical protein
MDTLRLNVSPRGKGYVAQSTAPAVTALGSSPEEAVESARLMALALFAKGPQPKMLIVYLDEPRIRTIVMQPMDKAFTLAALAEPTGWRYMASVSNDTPAMEAASE